MSSVLPVIHIAIDLDEVISPFLPHLTSYYIKNYKNNNMNLYSKYISNSDMYNYSKIFNISPLESKYLVKKFYSSQEAKKIRPYYNAERAILHFKRKNYKISIITGRQNYNECKQLTHAFVGKYFGSVIDNVYFTNSFSLDGPSVKKLDVCSSINANVLIDDCISNFDQNILNDNNILTVQYLHNPIHNWSCPYYENSINDLIDIEKFL